MTSTTFTSRTTIIPASWLNDVNDFVYEGVIPGGLVIPVISGGTGASTASSARTNLGVAIGSDVQAYDIELAAIAGLTSAADTLPYFTGSGTAALTGFTSAGRALVDDSNAAAQRTTLGVTATGSDTTYTYRANNLSDIASASTARTNLGLGTLATQNGTFSGTSSGTNTGDQTITLTGDVTGSGTGSFAATIGNTKVTYAKIQNVSATDKVLGRSTAGAGSVEEIICTSAGRALIDDADASAQRTTLGLGTIATQNANNVSISGGAITGITDITVADGGTGSSTASGARTNLGLVIGTDVEAHNTNLDAIAGLTSAANKGIMFTGSGTAGTYDLTAAGLALLDDANAAAQQTTLGLGTLATQSGTFSGTSSGTNTGDQNLFSTISVSGQSDVVADTASDVLTLVAGSNVTITTNAGTDTITVSATGGGGGGAPGGSDTQIQYNNASSFGGDSGFTTNGSGSVDIVGDLDIDNININGNTIISTDSNGNITLTPNGSGAVNISSPIALSGGVISGAGTPSNASDVATKGYVDGVVVGMSAKASCRVATTAALNATYLAGVLTNAGSLAALSIDGVALSTSDRVLVKNQSTASQNGWYSVTTVGSGAVAWVLTRTPDADATGEIVEGNYSIIEEGAVNAGALFIVTTSGTITIGTTAISFVQLVVASVTNPQLSAIAGLTSAADTLPYYTGSGTAALATFTSAGRALVDDANASAQRTTLGLVIGTDVQAYDADLTSLSTAYTTETATVASSLSLKEGTNNGTNIVKIIAPASIASDKTATLQDVTGTILVTGGSDVDVTDGGTGVSTMTTAYAPVCAGTTATGALQVASTGLSTSGFVLTSNGASALPSFQTATVSSKQVVQCVSTWTGTATTGSTVLPNDNTTPQNTEGDQYMSLAVTPTNSSNTLIIQVVIQGNNGTNNAWSAALFQDTTANALASSQVQGGTVAMAAMAFTYTMTAGTTSATTFKVRAGAASGTTGFNGISSGGKFNGTSASSIVIWEIKA